MVLGRLVGPSCCGLTKRGHSLSFCWEVEGMPSAAWDYNPMDCNVVPTHGLPVPGRWGWWWRSATYTADLAADQVVHMERTAP